MTPSPTRRDIETRLDDLYDEDIPESPPDWFVLSYEDRSEEWILDEWADTVRQSVREGTELLQVAWTRNLMKSYHDSEADADAEDPPEGRP